VFEINSGIAKEFKGKTPDCTIVFYLQCICQFGEIRNDYHLHPPVEQAPSNQEGGNF
jgi:hypothetical protein